MAAEEDYFKMWVSLHLIGLQSPFLKWEKIHSVGIIPMRTEITPYTILKSMA